jgi:hypothetical protein
MTVRTLQHAAGGRQGAERSGPAVRRRPEAKSLLAAGHPHAEPARALLFVLTGVLVQPLVALDAHLCPRSRPRIQRMPSGSRPLTGFVEHHHGRVAEQFGGDPEPLGHAHGVTAGLLTGHPVQAGHVEHLLDAVAGRSRRWRPARGGGGWRCGRDGRLGVQQRTHLAQGWRVLGVRAAVESDGAAGGASRPRMTRMADVPAPLGPRKPVTTPGRTVTVRWSTAVLSP